MGLQQSVSQFAADKIEKCFLLIYEELQCVKIIIHYLLLYLSAAQELLKGQ
jgi:hypothetical protein